MQEDISHYQSIGEAQHSSVSVLVFSNPLNPQVPRPATGPRRLRQTPRDSPVLWSTRSSARRGKWRPWSASVRRSPATATSPSSRWRVERRFREIIPRVLSVLYRGHNLSIINYIFYNLYFDSFFDTLSLYTIFYPQIPQQKTPPERMKLI